jgi:hypothetical protein
MGFDAFGNFVNVYSKFNIEPHFEKRFFNNTVLKYNEGSNKKVPTYWDSVRPLPLLTEEINDYRKKDSLELVRKDPHYLDSLDRKHNKPSVISILFTGQTFSKAKKRSALQIDPLLTAVQFNTVEGWVAQLRGSWRKRLDNTPGPGRSISISPAFRYGFSNQHLNANLRLNYQSGKKMPSSILVTGGKWIYQFNNANPITPLLNSLSSLFYERNYMKIYEAWFGRIDYRKSVGEGINLFTSLQYQDRIPLENTTDYTFKNSENREYTPNFPQDLMTENFQRHQALIAVIGASWKPGNRYVEFPESKISLGSKYPTFQLSLIKGIHNLLGSDINYTKWRFRINDQVNLKLFGRFDYNIVTGGFLQRDSVAVPDYQHFNGNLVAIASPYLGSFQLLPYYKYSNTSSAFVQVNLEHHFNGMLTNKIPVFRKLNWHLVGGVNAFYVNENNRYVEPFVGLENIFRIIRVDMIWGLPYKQPTTTGLRIGISGFDQVGD